MAPQGTGFVDFVKDKKIKGSSGAAKASCAAERIAFC